MDWTYVSSSNLVAVAYDETTQDLYIKFKSNSVYRYPNTDKSLFTGLINAPSKGRYHDAYIKHNDFVRVS